MKVTVDARGLLLLAFCQDFDTVWPRSHEFLDFSIDERTLYNIAVETNRLREFSRHAIGKRLLPGERIVLGHLAGLTQFVAHRAACARNIGAKQVVEHLFRVKHQSLQKISRQYRRARPSVRNAAGRLQSAHAALFPDMPLPARLRQPDLLLPLGIAGAVFGRSLVVTGRAGHARLIMR